MHTKGKNVTDSQADTFYLAPLRGVTARAFRNAFALNFAAPDAALSPFVASVAGERVKPGLLADIDIASEQRIPLIPQVIGKDPAQLRVMLRAFKALGHSCADLNVGCPWPFVMKKGRGGGLLQDADNLARMLEVGCAEMGAGFSIKVRLGLKTPDLLLERMALINSFPLRELCIHARTARQMYAGEVLLDEFETAAAACDHPVVYNGDIFSQQDFQYLKERFPGINRWMIGRGLVVDPFLMESIKAAEQVDRNQARLQEFIDSLLAAYVAELNGDNQVMGRMKELWSYLHTALIGGKRIWNSIKICRCVDEYHRVVESAFKRKIRFKDDLSRLKTK